MALTGEGSMSTNCGTELRVWHRRTHTHTHTRNMHTSKDSQQTHEPTPKRTNAITDTNTEVSGKGFEEKKGLEGG